GPPPGGSRGRDMPTARAPPGAATAPTPRRSLTLQARRLRIEGRPVRTAPPLPPILPPPRAPIVTDGRAIRTPPFRAEPPRAGPCRPGTVRGRARCDLQDRASAQVAPALWRGLPRVYTGSIARSRR